MAQGPPRRYSDKRCAGTLPNSQPCDRLMIAQRSWNAAGDQERKEMLAEGYVRQGVGLLCASCSTRGRRGRRP